MTDDERIQALQAALVEAVNAAALPLSVKALALENTLLRIQLAMQAQRDRRMNDDNAADT